jgi:hypothetical protein
MSRVGLAVTLVASDAFWTAIVAVLAIGPGYLLAQGLGRRLGWSWPAVLALGLAMSSAFAGVAGLAGYLTGSSLLVSSLLFLAIAAVGSWIGWRLGRGHPHPTAGIPGLIAGGVAAVVAVVQGPYMSLTGDAFYHLAAIRSLLVHGQTLVTDPFYGTAIKALDPTAGIWDTMVAMWSRLTGVDPVGLWIGMNALCAAALVFALWAVLRAVTRSERAATWGVAGYIVAALFIDFRTIGLPRNGSLALVMIAILGLLDMAERPSWFAAAVAVLGGFAASTVHLGSATLLYVAVASLVLWMAVDVVVRRVRDHHWRWREFLAVLATGAAIGIAATATLLPKLAVLSGSNVLGSNSAAGTSSAYLLPVGDGGQVIHWFDDVVSISPKAAGDAGVILSVFLLVICVLMAAAAFGRRRDRDALGALSLAGLPLLLLYNPVVTTVLYRIGPYMTERIAALMPFAAYVGIAWGIAQWGKRWWQRVARVLAFAALAAAVVLAAPYVWNTWTGHGGLARKGNRYPIYVSRLADIRYEWGLPMLERMRTIVGDRYPRVAGDLETTYYMAGLLPVSTLACLQSHSPAAIEQLDGAQRRIDNAEIIAPGAPDATRRALLDKWRVDYVVLRLNRPESLASAEDLRRHPELFRVVARSTTLVLFQVLK